MTESKKQHMARELHTYVRYLGLTGLDDTALFAATANRMDNFKALVDAADPSGMDSFAQRLPDLCHYAQLLTSLAAGIQDGTIKVSK